jgi:hypothetical protein
VWRHQALLAQLDQRALQVPQDRPALLDLQRVLRDRLQAQLVLSDLLDPAYVAQVSLVLQDQLQVLPAQLVPALVLLVHLVLVPQVRRVLVGYLDPCLFTSCDILRCLHK